MSRKLLRVPVVAEVLDTTTARAYELIRLGILPAVKLGRQIRVDASVLDDWITNGGASQPHDANQESHKR